MKKIIKFFIAAQMFASVGAGSGQALAGNGTKSDRNDSLTCLEVTGKVDLPGTHDRAELTVKLYKGNDLVDSLVVGTRKEFRFLLEKNTSYTVKISCKGHITRAVWIDTRLPEHVEHDPIFRFHFDTLLEKQEKMNKKNADVLDFPIALVYYDEEKGFFD